MKPVVATLLIITVLVIMGGLIILRTPGNTSTSQQSGQIIQSSPSPTKVKPLAVRGSIPYWDQDKAFASFSNHAEVFSQISLFWYYLGDDGTLKKYIYAKEDKNLIDLIHKKGVKVNAVITNLPEKGGWDSNRVEYLLETSARRANLISEIALKLTELDFDGVTIDFEEVEGDTKEKFTQFIKDLSLALHEKGKFVGVALHPKFGEPKDKRYGFQDWKELGKWADELYIMAYGEHYDEGEAGPIASYPWVKQIVEYALKSGVDREKFYLGIPLYGYDWNKDNDEAALGLTYSDVLRLIENYGLEKEWDAVSQSPYFKYEVKSIHHEVWFEDAQSVATKVKLADEVGLGGVTFWRLGGEDQLIWEEITKIKSTPSP